jgi:hypothetical protein
MKMIREFNARPAVATPEARAADRRMTPRNAVKDAFKGPLPPIPFFGLGQSSRFTKS